MTVFKIFKRDFPKVLKNGHSCLLLSGTQLLSQTINTLSDTGHARSLDDELSQTINTLSDTGHVRSLDDELSQSNADDRLSDPDTM